MTSASQNGSVVLPPVRGPFATGVYDRDTIRGSGAAGNPVQGGRMANRAGSVPGRPQWRVAASSAS
jgi:hypothetical protein